MSDRTLTSAQIASLLVSTSCGTGFLLGTGELALRQGMVGCIYAIASALGLVALATCARALAITRQSIWAKLDHIYGASIGRAVASLSLIWMTGVLAAQIRGATAILTMAGIGPIAAIVVVDLLLICLSTLRLSWLAAGFATCMLVCTVVLVRSLLLTDGFGVWWHAPIQLFNGLHVTTLDHTGFMFVSVILMVVWGADYQQFVLEAREPSMARNGCLVAAGLMFVIGFLPASAVIAASSLWHLQRLVDPVQAIPIVLMRTLAAYWINTASTLVIVVLLATALGAGCSLLRAMADATASLGLHSATRQIWSRILPITLGTIVTRHGQSLVDMMVDLNMVYISAVGPLLGLTLLNRQIPSWCASATLTIGSGIALALYLLRWTGSTTVLENHRLIASFLPPILITVLLWSYSIVRQKT